MKKLEDYIHLYIGCKIADTNNDAWVLAGVTESEVEPGKTIAICKLTEPYDNQVFREFYVEEVKLILRPLDSMTDDERMDFYEKYFGKRMADDYTGDTGSAYFQPKKVMPTTDHVMRIICGDDYHSGDFMKVVHMVPWLISKDLDLFGLIPAGLAIKREG